MDFSFDVRVLMCRNCGAPLQTGFTGGEVVCSYCGTTNVFTPRKEEPVEPSSESQMLSEEERIALLKRQDGKQPEIPAVIRQLLVDGVLAPWKEAEALAMWKTTCGELGSGSDFSSAELLYFLTIILSNFYSEKKDILRQRGLYESALEVLTLPRHRQLIRGMLSRNAALAGEVEAAEKWLEPCNPRSADLETDSSYRVSRAEIHTVRENWNGVLEILGRGIDEVPVTAALDAKAVVQRANALERTGHREEAAEQLSLFLGVNGAQGRQALKMITSVYSDAGIDICPESIAMAESSSSRTAGLALSQVENPGGCFGQIFAGSGVFLLLFGVVLQIIIHKQTGNYQLGAAIAMGLTGLIFLATGLRHIRAGKKVLRITTSGIPARGRIETIAPTGWKINKIPQYSLRVQVSLPGEDPYTVVTKRTIPDGQVERYNPGTGVDLKVDPENRNHVTVLD